MTSCLSAMRQRCGEAEERGGAEGNRSAAYSRLGPAVLGLTEDSEENSRSREFLIYFAW